MCSIMKYISLHRLIYSNLTKTCQSHVIFTTNQLNNRFPALPPPRRFFTTNNLLCAQKEPPIIQRTEAQKKAKISPKITLISPNKSMMVTTLEEAQKLAKRRDLRLILQEQYDTKTQRAIYKLVTAAQILAEEEDGGKLIEEQDKAKNQKKSSKSLTIGARISENDLSSRLKNINKWLSKNHEVRVAVQGSPNENSNCERIVATIEQSLKTPHVVGKIQQKRAKAGVIRFSIVPVVMEKAKVATVASDAEAGAIDADATATAADAVAADATAANATAATTEPPTSAAEQNKSALKQS